MSRTAIIKDPILANEIRRLWTAIGSPKETAKKPTTSPPGEKEGMYEVDGETWKWTQQKGWFK